VFVLLVSLAVLVLDSAWLLSLVTTMAESDDDSATV
jgi:hypothetical protein